MACNGYCCIGLTGTGLSDVTPNMITLNVGGTVTLTSSGADGQFIIHGTVNAAQVIAYKYALGATSSGWPNAPAYINAPCTLYAGTLGTAIVTGDCTLYYSPAHGQAASGNFYTYPGPRWPSGFFAANPARIPRVIGNCTFNDSCFFTNLTSVVGNVVLNDTAQMQSPINFPDDYTFVTGSVTLNSPVAAGIRPNLGSLVLNGQSYVSVGSVPLTVAGGATFNDSSYNLGTFVGPATFNDESRNEGTITGNASFLEDSFNVGTVTGSVTWDGFTGTNAYGTFVNGQIQPRTMYFTGSDWSNLSSWWDDDTFASQASSLPNSSDSVVLAADCTWNSGSTPTVVNLTTNWAFGISITVTGTATFAGAAYNTSSGYVTGNATFTDTAANSGTITGNATFTDTAANSGTIAGNATFTDTAANSGTITGNATFTGTNTNTGTITGTTYVDGCLNGAYYFDNVATTLACGGNGVWNGNFYYNGEVTGPIPSTIYVRTTGSDATGNATEASPLATAQYAFNAAASVSGDIVIDFGVGNFGGVTLTQDWPSRISVRGAGVAQSFIGGINGNGADGWYDWNAYTNYAPTGGRSISVVSDNSVQLGSVSANGGNASGSADDPSTSGGSITLTDASSTSLSVAGGNGYSWNLYSFYPGAAGTITLAGGSTVPDTLNGNVVTTNLRKGRGVNGSNILGIA
jgi:hypothetical protein